MWLVWHVENCGVFGRMLRKIYVGMGICKNPYTCMSFHNVVLSDLFLFFVAVVFLGGGGGMVALPQLVAK